MPIDLFSGRKPITGVNKFKADKNPLDQLTTSVTALMEGQKAGVTLPDPLTLLHDAWVNMFVPLIQQLTGIDLSSMPNFINSVITDIENSLGNLESVIGNIVQAITGKPGGSTELSQWVADLTQSISNADAKAQSTIESIFQGWFGPIDTVLNPLDPTHVQAALTDVANAIAALRLQLAGSGGVLEQFASYAAGSSLGSKWNQIYAGPSTILAPGDYGIKNNVAKFVTSPGVGRFCLSLYAASVTNTDNQAVYSIYTSSPASNANAYNELVARSNATGTERVFAKLLNSAYQIGHTTPAHGTVILGSGGLKFTPTNNYELHTTGWTFELYENTRLVESVVDTQQWSMQGATHRSVGMAAGAGGLLAQPGDVSAFGFSDK